MKHVLLLMLAAIATPASAQETRQLPPGGVSPPATIDQLGWLAGEWRGDGIDAPATEVYSQALGGQIAGHFVQMDKQGGVAFQELVQIFPRGGSLVYRVRHFNADFTGWEDKSGRFVEFPLVALEPNAAYFAGLTVRRDGDKLVSTVVIRENGKAEEISFRYTRVKR